MKFYEIIFIALCMLLFAGCSSKGDNDVLFNPDLRLSEALQMADSIAETGDIDKALATYHYISKQAEALPRNDTVNATAAFNAALTEAQIYFNNNSDYGSVLKSLLCAQKIARNFNLSQNAVDFLLGNLYVTVAEQNNVDSYFDKAADYFVAVIDSPEPADTSLSCYAVSNLILYSDRGKVAAVSADALRRYFSSSISRHTDGYEFNMKLDSIMSYLHARDYDMAMKVIDRLSRSPRLPNQRVLPGIFFISGKISAGAGNYAEALNFFKESEKLVDPKHGQDMELQVYEALEDVYSRLGNEFMTGKYAEKANRLRREITSFSQISSFKHAEFAEEINGMEADLTHEKEKSRNLLRWSIIGLVFGILAAVIIGMLLFFMRRLREKNQVLYLRYVELLQLNNSPQKDVAEEESVEEIPVEEEEVCIGEETDNDDREPGDVAAAGAERLFTDEVKRIEEMLSESEELFSCDFSAATLSVLSGIKPRLLSTIISDHYHTSFRNLINSRRIRAVCRKLETGTDYDNLTVDAIAESVGIKSRATFTSAFKRETGMTPAQYIRFARERKAS